MSFNKKTTCIGEEEKNMASYIEDRSTRLEALSLHAVLGDVRQLTRGAREHKAIYIYIYIYISSTRGKKKEKCFGLFKFVCLCACVTWGETVTPKKKKKKRERKSEHVSKKGEKKRVNYGTDSHTNVQTNKGSTLKAKLYKKKK